MTTKYFKNISTGDELKAKYHELAKKLHPDLGGSHDEFVAMQAEFEKLWATFKNLHKNAKGETYVHETDATASEYMDIIEQLLKFEGVNVEICGTWIWATGNTKPYKDEFKQLKFKYSPNKQAWFYFEGEYIKKTPNKYSMDTIRKMWGSESYGTGKSEKDEKEDEKLLQSANKSKKSK